MAVKKIQAPRRNDVPAAAKAYKDILDRDGQVGDDVVNILMRLQDDPTALRKELAKLEVPDIFDLKRNDVDGAVKVYKACLARDGYVREDVASMLYRLQDDSKKLQATLDAI